VIRNSILHTVGASLQFQEALRVIRRLAESPRKAELCDIVREHAADIVQFGGRHDVLRLHHFDVVGDSGLVALSRQPEILLGHSAIPLRDFDLARGGLQVQPRIAHVAFDAAKRVRGFRIALSQDRIRPLDFPFGPATLPDRDIKSLLKNNLHKTKEVGYVVFSAELWSSPRYCDDSI